MNQPHDIRVDFSRLIDNIDQHDEADLETSQVIHELRRLEALWMEDLDELRKYRLPLRGDPDFAIDDGSGYDRSDPKHPDWHSVHSDIWDMRAGK
jgi:hypothetical protein